jgi:hypothetical protein
MLQSFECPNCQARLDYDSKAQSLTVLCAYCSSTVIVPDSLRTNRTTQSGQQTQALAQIVQLVQNGRKIEAIKLFRDTFAVGLKEAKDVVDAIERHEDIHLGGTNFHTEAVTFSTYSTTPTVQTSGGVRTGCTVMLVMLVLTIIGAAVFLMLIIPANSETTLQRVSSALGDNSAEPNAVATANALSETLTESIMESIQESLPNIPTADPEFAAVVLQIGGEEGIGPGFFNDTRRLAIDGDGNIYTGDYSGGRIQVFEANGKFLATWNAGEELYMTGMTVNRAGTLYLIRSGNIEKYNGLTGEFLGAITLPGGQRNLFETVGTGPDGSVYLVAQNRLVRLDNSDTITLDITDPFANIPNFDVLRYNVAIDGAGNIFLLGRYSVYKLDANGRFANQFGSRGDADDQFTSPTSLAVDGKGRIFVDDIFGIKVFDSNGRYLAALDSPGVAFDMLFTDENELLIMDRNGNEVRKYRLND